MKAVQSLNDLNGRNKELFMTRTDWYGVKKVDTFHSKKKKVK